MNTSNQKTSERMKKQFAEGTHPFQQYKERMYLGIPEELRGITAIPQQIINPHPAPVYVPVDKRKFIEDQFLIRAKEEQGNMGYVIPFKLNKVQNKYYDAIFEDRPDFEGVREIILKARQQGFCASEQSKVLTTDLKWIKLKDIQIGQELIAVDEFPEKGRGKDRKIRGAIVEGKRNVYEKAFELKMDNGQKLILTAPHRLLSVINGGTYTKWKSVSELKKGERIRYITRVWGESNLDDAWMGGIIDGEGHIRAKKSGGAEVKICQVKGDVWDKMVDYTKRSGFSYREDWDNRKAGEKSKFGNKPVGSITFDRMNELFELLGKTGSLKGKKIHWWDGKSLPGKRSGKAWSKILSIKPLGKKRMVDLQTSEKTFILDGFVSHNSSFILALFTVDFLTRPNSVSVCISYRSDETKRLFRRVHFYIESYCEKNGFDVRDYLSVDTKDELENATNNSYFYIGTAGAKVGGRGATVTNLHFSEAAFFEDTEKITAKEIIEATSQQVPQEHGMVFIESTGGNVGSYYQGEWERAKRQESNYKPRFFAWNEFYSNEWIDKKKRDFSSEAEFKSHYPADEAEAFIFSGNPFFDSMILNQLRKEVIDPIFQGRLAPDGSFL